MNLGDCIAKAKAKIPIQRSVKFIEIQPMPQNCNPARKPKSSTSTAISRPKPTETHGRSSDVEELMKTIKHQKVFIQNLQKELSDLQANPNDNDNDNANANANENDNANDNDNDNANDNENAVTVSQPVLIIFNEQAEQSEAINEELVAEVDDPLESTNQELAAEQSESDDNIPLSQYPRTTRNPKKTVRKSKNCEYCFQKFTSAKHVRDHITGE